MLSEEEVARRKAELEERRALKRAYRRRQKVIYSICIVVGIILMVLTASYTYQRGLRGTQAMATKDERLLVLFLGTDEKAEGGTRLTQLCSCPST